MQERIATEIKNHKGLELPKFRSHRACKNVVKELLKKYEIPANDLLENISSKVDEVMRKVAEDKLSGYTPLMQRVKVRIREKWKQYCACCNNYGLNQYSYNGID